MKEDFHAHHLAQHQGQIVEYRAGQANAVVKGRESTILLYLHHAPSFQAPDLVVRLRGSPSPPGFIV